MAVRVTCTSCNRPTRVPEDVLGKRVRCPYCFAPFTADEALVVTAGAGFAVGPVQLLRANGLAHRENGCPAGRQGDDSQDQEQERLRKAAVGAPVAGCQGFWTCTLAGLVAPLLAT